MHKTIWQLVIADLLINISAFWFGLVLGNAILSNLSDVFFRIGYGIVFLLGAFQLRKRGGVI